MKKQIKNYVATLSSAMCLLKIYGSSRTGIAFTVESAAQLVRLEAAHWVALSN